MISERTLAASFESFWMELLPLLTPRFVTLFNEGHSQGLNDANGHLLGELPIGENIERPDIVAEFAFQLAKQCWRVQFPLDEIQETSPLTHDAENEAFKLILRYEGKPPSVSVPLSECEKREGMELCRRYSSLYRLFDRDKEVRFSPKFSGSGILNSCEGDISIGATLIEVKTTTRRVSGKDVRQLLVYAALESQSGIVRWDEVAIFNPRRGMYYYAALEELVLSLSGGKPSIDVFSEMIAFLESGHSFIESRF